MRRSGVAAQKKAAARKAVKKRLVLKGYSKLKNEVRKNTKPPCDSTDLCKIYPILKIESTVN
jgi:hypothetical protein